MKVYNTTPDYWVLNQLLLLLLLLTTAAVSTVSADVTPPETTESNTTTTTTSVPRFNITYNQPCTSSLECNANEDCRWEYDFTCKCELGSKWDYFEQACIRSTLNGSCYNSFDCESNQVCEEDYSTGRRQCVCRLHYRWEELFGMCLAQMCWEWCDVGAGKYCSGDECRFNYDWAEPDYPNRPPPGMSVVPLTAIFGVVTLAMICVLAMWKCAVMRRMRQTMSATTLHTISVSTHQQQRPPSPQPPRNDEPPKYSHLTGPMPWYQAPAMRQPATSPVTLIDSSVQAQTTSVALVSSSAPPPDSPPPYSEVAPQFAAPQSQQQQQQQRY